jgi:hypothetical protein
MRGAGERLDEREERVHVTRELDFRGNGRAIVEVGRQDVEPHAAATRRTRSRSSDVPLNLRQFRRTLARRRCAHEGGSCRQERPREQPSQ